MTNLRLVALCLAVAAACAPATARTVFVLEPTTATIISYDTATNLPTVLSGGPGNLGSGAALKTPLGLAVRPDGHLLVLQEDDGTAVECLDVDPVNGARLLLSTLSRAGDIIPGPRVYTVLPDGRAVLHGSVRASMEERVLLLQPATGAVDVVQSPEVPPSRWLAIAPDQSSIFYSDSLNRHVDQVDFLTGAQFTPFPRRIAGIIPAPVDILDSTHPYPFPPLTIPFPFTAGAPLTNPAPVSLQFKLRPYTADFAYALHLPDGGTVSGRARLTGASDRDLVESGLYPIHPVPAEAYTGPWTLDIIKLTYTGNNPPYVPRLFEAELRTTELSNVTASAFDNGTLHVIDDHGTIARLDTVSLTETVLSRASDDLTSPPLGRAAAIVPLESGDDLLVEDGTGRAFVASATTGARTLIGNVFPDGLLPPGGVSCGASVQGIAIAPVPDTSAPGSDPTTVLATLDSTQWEADSLDPPFTAPAFSESGGLGLATTNPTNSFGFWQTRQPLAAPPAGTYRLTVNLLGTAIGEGKRHPEIRVRVFSADNRHTAMRLNAETTPGGGISAPLEIQWTSDGVTPWRVAIDMLSFAPDVEGGVIITSVTNRTLYE